MSTHGTGSSAKRTHEQMAHTADGNAAVMTSNTASNAPAAGGMGDAAASVVDGDAPAHPASKRARLAAVPLTDGDLAHIASQRALHSSDPHWKGARVLVDTSVEVLPSGAVLVHLDVALDCASRRAAKRASRAALTSARHRDKKIYQKAAKKVARAEAKQTREQEEARMRAEGKDTEQIRAHFKALNTKVPKPNSRVAKAHRTALLEQMAANSLQKIVIDCSFDHLMKLEEVCSLAKQLKYIYGHNMRSPRPVHMIVSSLLHPPADFTAGEGWDDKAAASTALRTKETATAASTAAASAAVAAETSPVAPAAPDTQATVSPPSSSTPAPTSSPSTAAATSAAASAPAPEMYTRALLSRLDGFDRLAFDRTDAHYTALPNVPREKLVYLTAESDTVLTKLDKNKVYVIGGIVDHNRMKGLCHRLALQAGIPTARLPIQEYLINECRTVITVNQVFEILLRAQEHDTCDWAAIMKEVLPARSNWQERTPAAAAAAVAKRKAGAAGGGDSASASTAVAAASSNEETDATMEEQEDDARNERLEHEQAKQEEEEAEEGQDDAEMETGTGASA